MSFLIVYGSVIDSYSDIRNTKALLLLSGGAFVLTQMSEQIGFVQAVMNNKMLLHHVVIVCLNKLPGGIKERSNL